MGVDWEVGYMSLSSPVFHKGGGNDDMFNHPKHTLLEVRKMNTSTYIQGWLVGDVFEVFRNLHFIIWHLIT